MRKKYLITVLLVIITFLISIENVFANTIKGSYHFTSNENNNIQLEDTFEYRDDYFKTSSYYGNRDLEILSAQVSEASCSWYGEKTDPYEIDYTNNAHNLIDFLSQMEFEKVSANQYYSLEKQENSAGVVVGYKKITVDEKTYTLLAIIPRSAGYKQEWAGNFTVGEGKIHEGFKAARDEILRFVKKYIADNHITGDLKIWTAGHSRGSALANMVGGFFAGGGISYFGNTVSISPEDVYCYTFATPKTVKQGLEKNIELMNYHKNELMKF